MGATGVGLVPVASMSKSIAGGVSVARSGPEADDPESRLKSGAGAEPPLVSAAKSTSGFAAGASGVYPPLAPAYRGLLGSICAPIASGVWHGRPEVPAPTCRAFRLPLNARAPFRRGQISRC